MEGSRIRRSLVRLVLTAALALGFVGTAFAHSVSFETSLTLTRSPRGTVSRGTVVTFSGRLRSPKGACERNSQILLVKIGTGVVAKDRTNATGEYKIRKRVRRTARWRTRFNGKVLTAVHPHNHVCAASLSDSIRVKVTRR